MFGLTFFLKQRLEITGIDHSQVQCELFHFIFRMFKATVVLISFHPVASISVLNTDVLQVITFVCNIEG